MHATVEVIIFLVGGAKPEYPVGQVSFSLTKNEFSTNLPPHKPKQNFNLAVFLQIYNFTTHDAHGQK